MSSYRRPWSQRLFRFHHTESMYSGEKRPVGGVDVHPEADPLGEGLPLVDIVADRFAAQPGELGDAHLLLDLPLVGDAQLPLHLDLDRQTVGVPSGPAGNGIAPHGAVAAEQVLVDPGPHVVESGPPVGRRRTLVEHPGLGPRPELDGTLEDAVLGPSDQLVGLEGGEIGFGWAPDGTTGASLSCRLGQAAAGRGRTGPAGGGDTTGAEGPQLTRARTSRGRSPHRRSDAPHVRTTDRAVPVDLVLGPQDRRAAAGGTGGPDRHRGGASGEVRLHRRRWPLAGGPPGPGRVGPLVREPPVHRPQAGPEPDRPPGGPGRRGRLRRHRDGQREAPGPLGGARPRSRSGPWPSWVSTPWTPSSPSNGWPGCSGRPRPRSRTP